MSIPQHIHNLALARQDLAESKEAQAVLKQESAVTHYLASIDAVKEAQGTEKQAYRTLVSTIMADYDGHQRHPHEAVEIVVFKGAEILREDIALLWLLSYMEAVSLKDCKGLIESIEQVAKNVTLSLNRAQASALLDTLFVDEAGNPVERITFAQPKDTLKPRIKRDLSDYLEA